MATDGYKLVALRNGTHAVYATAYDEKMHPGLGPAAEAEALYVRQLKVRERMQQLAGEFVVWDVGLGAAANALTLLRLTRDLPCPLHLVSFDDTTGPLEFALQHTEQLDYLAGYESVVADLLRHRSVTFDDHGRKTRWDFLPGDFPAWLARRSPARCDVTAPSQRTESEPAAPHAIFYDAFSPAKNPAMWTLPVFTNLFRQLDSARPCSLTTYSRSTMLRVALLLAGFFVGRGSPTGLKEETTVAANSLALIADPLDGKWLERIRRSDSAEPLHEAVYRKLPLTPVSSQSLQRHPQFA